VQAGGRRFNFEKRILTMIVYSKLSFTAGIFISKVANTIPHSDNTYLREQYANLRSLFPWLYISKCTSH